MIHFRHILFYCALLFLVACNSAEKAKQKKLEETISSIQAKNEFEENTVIVAKVNNTLITKNQLDYTMARLLPKNIDKNTKEKFSEKVLNSLIDSRLMAIVEEKKLDKQELQLINIKMEAYREELLVKRYITENIEPQPITQEAIYQYYQEHLEEFGENLEKTYEIVQSKSNLTKTERAELLTKLSNLATVDNWSNWFKENENLSISYRKITSPVGILKKPLKILVEATADGEISPLLNEKMLTIVRVDKSKKIPAKSFEQVSGKIRRMMAPQALKKTLRDHLIKLKKSASINYLLKAESMNATLSNKNDIAGVRK